MGRFYYQLAVGTFGPKVRIGGVGGGVGNAQRSEVRISINKRENT